MLHYLGTHSPTMYSNVYFGTKGAAEVYTCDVYVNIADTGKWQIFTPT